MRYAGDHDNDDELAFDSGPRAPTGIFTPDSKLQDSITTTQGAAPVTLVEAVARGEVPQLIAVNLAIPVGQSVFPPGMVPFPVDAEAVATVTIGMSPYSEAFDLGDHTRPVPAEDSVA